MIRLIEKGVVTRLKKKWWEEERGGGSCKDVGGASSDQMGVAALAGLYMMLIAGIAFAAIIAVCEFTWRKRKLAVDENVRFGGNYFIQFNLIFLSRPQYGWKCSKPLSLQ